MDAEQEAKVRQFSEGWNAEFRPLDAESGIDSWLSWVAMDDVNVETLLGILRKVRLENAADPWYRPGLSVVQHRYYADVRRYQLPGQTRTTLQCGLCKDSGYMYVAEGGQNAREARILLRDAPEYFPYLGSAIIPCRCSKGRRIKQRKEWQRLGDEAFEQIHEFSAFRAPTNGAPDFGYAPVETFLDECFKLKPKDPSHPEPAPTTEIPEAEPPGQQSFPMEVEVHFDRSGERRVVTMSPESINDALDMAFASVDDGEIPE